MPFCKAHFFPITGILPFTIQKEIGESEEHKEEHTKLISTVLSYIFLNENSLKYKELYLAFRRIQSIFWKT